MKLTNGELESQLKKVTPEAAAQIVKYMQDKFPGDDGSKSIVSAWMQFALTSPELLAAQGLYTAQEKQDDVDKRADELIDIIDDKQLEIISKRAELATLSQQVADYREALRYIGECLSEDNLEGSKTARAVLDKYPQ
jgi:hypothetical protein